MSSVLGRVAALMGLVWVLPGCLEVAVIAALQGEEPDDISSDEGRFDSEIFGDDEGTAIPDDALADGTVDLRNGTLLGDLGDVRDFDDEAPLLRGWTSEGYTNLEVIARKEDGSGAAMAIVAITGDLDDPALDVGRHLEFQLADYPATGLYVNLIGCSGPIEGDWQFDQGADTVTLDVTEGTTPNARTLDFEGTFVVYDASGSTREQVVIGSVEVGETHPD